ncbi:MULTISPECIES: hypothetical protein [Dietzia]|uniref:hypothetical protein n=1 Tax=Dietzia TaxID=37914 RepID=UPI001E625301|nr:MULTISPECIES: hypothetical protein [Dietzia]MCT2059582.1 hypothetical protein [Dietzia cinnamea]
MKFRTTDLDARFKKYEIIKIPGTYRGADDPRPESFKPRQDGIVHGRVVDSSKNWRERRDLLGGLLGATTTCDLIRANPAGEMAKPAPSLGLIKPTVRSVEVVPGEPWTPAERAKIEAASAPDLFGNEVPPLEAAPYSVRYKYNCAHPLCAGHNQKVLDWELGQAGRRWARQYGPKGAAEKIRQKWGEQLISSDRDVHFFVGNQARYRQSFSVLGIWYPRMEDPALF